MSTVFAKIITRELPASIVYEDECFLAFHDIAPQAPIHIIVIPKLPIPSLDEATEGHKDMLGGLLLTAKKIANTQGLHDYRVIFNTGAKAGQTVFHLHLHLLGGTDLTEDHLAQ